MNDEVIYLFDIVILSFLAIFEIFAKSKISKKERFSNDLNYISLKIFHYRLSKTNTLVCVETSLSPLRKGGGLIKKKSLHLREGFREGYLQKVIFTKK